MKTINKVKGTAVAMPVGVALGVFVSITVTLLSVALLTSFVLNGKISGSSIGYFVMGILVLAATLGALISAGKIKRRRILVCSVTGAVYFLILLMCTAFFFGGNFRGLGVSALMVLIGSLGAALLGMRKGNGHGRVSKKYRTG